MISILASGTELPDCQTLTQNQFNRPAGTGLFSSRFQALRAGTSCQATIVLSLRDADHMDGQPGDKSPGYYRAPPGPKPFAQ
jgi:hypothetical protein